MVNRASCESRGLWVCPSKYIASVTTGQVVIIGSDRRFNTLTQRWWSPSLSSNTATSGPASTSTPLIAASDVEKIGCEAPPPIEKLGRAARHDQCPQDLSFCHRGCPPASDA